MCQEGRVLCEVLEKTSCKISVDEEERSPFSVRISYPEAQIRLKQQQG